MRRLLWLSLLALTIGCSGNPGPRPPKPPTTTTVAITVAESTTGRPIPGATVWWQPKPAATMQTDATGAASLIVDTISSGVCARKTGFTTPGPDGTPETCVPLTSSSARLLLEPPEPPKPPVIPTPDVKPGTETLLKVFVDAKTGQAWRWKGVTAFRLANRWQQGETAAVHAFLEAYRGYNTLRVFAYIKNAPNTQPGKGWKIQWEPPPVENFKAFLADVGERGWTVELTLLTDDDATRLPWAKTFVAALAAAPRPTNLVIEIGNEPTTHKNIDTQALKAACDASGFVYASGNYEDNAKAFGKFGDAHTPRDSEWPRKAHDLMEHHNGGGPHSPSEPARKFPWVGDEPAKTEDVAAPTPGPLHLTKADDWRAYFGTCALLGAGCTFHAETAKYADLPTADERTLAAAALEGLDAFPAEAPKGSYARPSDSSLRTYTIDGKWMVRVRPTTDTPSGGWTRIGSSSILWKR